MYIGRFPLFSFAILAAASLVLVGVTIVLAFRFRGRKLAAAIIVLATPVIARAIIEPGLAAQARHGLYIVLSVFFDLYPILAVLLVLGIASAVFRGPRAAAYRATFIALTIVFAALNTANWCQPG